MVGRRATQGTLNLPEGRQNRRATQTDVNEMKILRTPLGLILTIRKDMRRMGGAGKKHVLTWQSCFESSHRKRVFATMVKKTSRGNPESDRGPRSRAWPIT